MRNLYRKLALAVPLVVGATIGVAPSAFAGVTSAPGVPSPHGSFGAAHVASSHVVAPISTGWVDITDSNGNVTQKTGVVLEGPNIDDAVSLTIEGPGLFDLSVSDGFPTQAGDIDAQTGGSTASSNGGTNSPIGIISEGDSCNSTLGSAGGTSVVQVDQFVQSGANPPTAEAVQFDCLAADGTEFSGALAYNISPTTVGAGYYIYGAAGELTGFGNDNYLNYLGNLTATNLSAPIVGMAITPDGGGYWMVASDGGIFAYGDATFYGSMGGVALDKPIVGMAVTPSGHGYWLVAADGGIFAFGDAQFSGSMGGKPLDKPIVGIAADPNGGYWMVASDGGIFAFGGAPFLGSMGGHPLDKPIVGMTVSPDGGGYWFVASDGGIFAYGNAGFHGSMGGTPLSEPVVGMDVAVGGNGYRLVASDGGIFSFNAPFAGSLGGLGITDAVGITS